MTLYEQLGGEPAIVAALDHFYARVLKDPELAPFFDGIDVKAMNEKQKVFLAMAFGGPQAYDGPGLNAVHASARAKGLDDRLFDKFLGHFKATLIDLGVAEPQVSEVMAIAESGRGDVLARF